MKYLRYSITNQQSTSQWKIDHGIGGMAIHVEIILIIYGQLHEISNHTTCQHVKNRHIPTNE